MKNWKKKNKISKSQVKSKKGVSYLFLFILFGGLAYSCQNRPKEVLNKKQMERLMYDVYIAEATMENDYRNFDTPEKKEAYINRVFKAHKTTQAQWDTSLSWYSDRIDIYLKMNDSVKARLQRTRQGIDAMVEKQRQELWIDPTISPSYLPSSYIFSMSDTRKGFRFRLDSTQIFSRVTGDDFLFTFSAVGVPPRLSSPFTSLLTLVYSDTTIYRFQEIRENRIYEFSGSKYIPGDTITEITGFVRLQDPTGVIPHIQLYNISFGDISSTTLQSDTSLVGVGMNTLEVDSLIPQTEIPLNPDSIIPLKPESGKFLKPDSIQ